MTLDDAPARLQYGVELAESLFRLNGGVPIMFLRQLDDGTEKLMYMDLMPKPAIAVIGHKIGATDGEVLMIAEAYEYPAGSPDFERAWQLAADSRLGEMPGRHELLQVTYDQPRECWMATAMIKRDPTRLEPWVVERGDENVGRLARFF